MSTERVDTIVVGAGMAGLLAARVAAAGGATVAVVDPQPPGGRARTDERQGYRWNRGPHALYHGGAAERLLQQFGVPLAGGAPAGGYFGSLGGIVEPLPVGPASLVRSHLLSTRGKASLARSRAKLLAADPSTLGGVSFDEWLDGLRITADAAALQRMLARVGTYCCATDIAAADMVVGQMQQAMRAGVHYLDGGWQVLVARSPPVWTCAAARWRRWGVTAVTSWPCWTAAAISWAGRRWWRWPRRTPQRR
ncbi:MAG: NAD(P)-binding protein [Ilumatobacteraceae bacterium]